MSEGGPCVRVRQGRRDGMWQDSVFTGTQMPGRDSWRWFRELFEAWSHESLILGVCAPFTSSKRL